jgi:NAD(P)-dependent dehydrogenase (short-subunit alcohol dehydrogenase family)
MARTAVPVARGHRGRPGIGRKVAEALAGQGSALTLTDLGEPAKTLQAVRGRGAQALTAVGDLTSQADLAALAEHIRRQLGGVRVLVNNAGSRCRQPPSRPG